MNRRIEVEGNILTVTAVISDIPRNSHIRFDMIKSFDLLETENEIYKKKLYTTKNYLLLSENTSIKNLTGKINNRFYEARENKDISLELQSLKDIHFTTNLQHDDAVIVNKIYIRLFWITGIFILLRICCHYINLSTATLEGQTKGVEIREIIGASGKRIAAQIYIEAIVILVMAANVLV